MHRILRWTEWLRLHSLADSKRDPETDAELSEIVHRKVAVANSMFVIGESINVFRSKFYFPNDAQSSSKIEASDTVDIGIVFRAGANP